MPYLRIKVLICSALRSYLKDNDYIGVFLLFAFKNPIGLKTRELWLVFDGII